MRKTERLFDPCFRKCLTNPLFVKPHRAEQDFSIRADKVVGGIRLYPILLVSVIRLVSLLHADFEGEVVLMDILVDLLFGVATVQCHNQKAFCLELIIQLLKVRKLLTARPSPIKPEVDQNGFLLFEGLIE